MKRMAAAALAGALVVAIAPFVLDGYTANVLVRSLLFGVLALSVDLLWGFTGFLTFGQSAFFGVGAYAYALTATQLGVDGFLLPVSLLLGLLAPAVLALLQGWLSFYHRATPLYASVVSLVVPVVVTQVLYSGGTFTGSSSGLTGYDMPDLSVPQWLWLCGGLLVLLTAAAAVFVRSDAGRLLVALRDNEMRCAFLGIPTTRLRIGLLIAMAAVAGLAGWLYAAYSGVVAPELAGFDLGTQAVIWVALGGRGTLVGPVLGAIGIDLTSAYLSGSLPFLWRLLVGLAFILVIVLLPQGLFPAIGRLILHRRRAAPVAPPALVPAATATARARGEALAVSDVARHFGALPVLSGVSLRAAAGELLSLVGPNGAGKTTLIRCLSDGTERSGGTVHILGQRLGSLPPHRCVALGLGRKFQTANVFDSLTVAECLRIARATIDRPSPWRRAGTLALPDAAMEVVQATGLDRLLGEEARLLAHGQKQALELAMVLALDPALVLLDEPTAGLTRSERLQIGGILRRLAQDHGMCLLLVEHDLDFVREISTRMVVLHQGRMVLDGTVEEVAASDLVRTIYAGEPH
ncbi:MAG: ATP-binding cassette domain-containing protein [Alphaproteobacteria bacterium]|nr:ATP-binding cassette domain-containing protein [Alphaproteobacteria bacterium]